MSDSLCLTCQNYLDITWFNDVLSKNESRFGCLIPLIESDTYINMRMIIKCSFYQRKDENTTG